MQLNQALEVAIGDVYKSTGGWRVKRMGCGRGRRDRRGNLFQSGVKTDGDSERKSKLGRCLWGRREGVD